MAVQGDSGGDNTVSKAVDRRRFEELWAEGAIDKPRTMSSSLVMAALGLFFLAAPFRLMMISVIAGSLVFLVLFLLRHVLPVSFGTKRRETLDGFIIESTGVWVGTSALLLVMGVMMIRAWSTDIELVFLVVAVGWVLVACSFIGVGGAELRMRGNRLWFAYSWHTRRVLEVSGCSAGVERLPSVMSSSRVLASGSSNRRSGKALV